MPRFFCFACNVVIITPITITRPMMNSFQKEDRPIRTRLLFNIIRIITPSIVPVMVP